MDISHLLWIRISYYFQVGTQRCRTAELIPGSRCVHGLFLWRLRTLNWVNCFSNLRSWNAHQVFLLFHLCCIPFIEFGIIRVPEILLTENKLNCVSC